MTKLGRTVKGKNKQHTLLVKVTFSSFSVCHWKSGHCYTQFRANGLSSYLGAGNRENNPREIKYAPHIPKFKNSDFLLYFFANLQVRNNKLPEMSPFTYIVY